MTAGHDPDAGGTAMGFRTQPSPRDCLRAALLCLNCNAAEHLQEGGVSR